MVSNTDGFFKKENLYIDIPETYFSQYLPYANSLEEMKLSLYLFWHQEKVGDGFNGLTLQQILEDSLFADSFATNLDKPSALMQKAIDDLIHKKIIVQQSFEKNSKKIEYYFINNFKGNASATAIKNGKWHPDNQSNYPIHLAMVAPNIFKLYEENIGPLTPMVSDTLIDAEKDYPADWIAEAIKIGVDNNVRKWNYIEAILKRWKEEGKHERTDQENAKKRKRKYAEGEDAEFFQD